MAVNTFTQNPVTPSQTQYADFTLSSTPLQLQWPNDYSDGVAVLATFMNINSTADGQIIKLPPVNQNGDGAAFDIINNGSFSFIVQSYNGTPLLTMQPLTAAEGVTAATFFVIDNTSDTTGWDSLALGAAFSSAQAEILAGYGLIALPAPTPPARSVLNTNSPVITVNTNFNLDSTYRASVVNVVNAITCTLDNPVSPDGFYCDLINNGSNSLTIDANGLFINGVPSINLGINQSVRVVSDGTTYYGYNLPNDISVEFNAAVYTVSGGLYQIPALVLDESQSLIFKGTLTSNVTILLDPFDGIFYVSNYCINGAFTFTIAQNDGAGVAQGTSFTLQTNDCRIFENLSETISGTPTPGLVQIPNADSISGSFPNGSVIAPSITFTNADSTGFYLAQVSPPAIGIAVNTLNVQTWSETLIAFGIPVSFTDTVTFANPIPIDQGGTGTGTAPTAIGQSLIADTLTSGIWGGFSIKQIQLLQDNTQQDLSGTIGFITTYQISLDLTADNSRIFLMGNFWVSNHSATGAGVGYLLYQNGSTPLIGGGVAGINVTGTINYNSNPTYTGDGPTQYTIQYLSPVLPPGNYTYRVQVIATGSGPRSVFYNRGLDATGSDSLYGTASTLYALEIGGF